MPVTEETKPNDNLGGFTSYKEKYSSMKTKLKDLLYENELFQDELRKLQRELLDIYRDKEALLERVIQYEDMDSSNSDSESQTSDNIISASQMKQQPMMTTQSNHTFHHQQAFTMVASTCSGNLIHPQPIDVTPATTTHPVVASKGEFDIPQTQVFNDNNYNSSSGSNINNTSNTVKTTPNKSTANSKPKAATSRSRSKPTAKAAKNGTTNKTNTGGVIKQTAPRNQKQKQQQSQPQPPTISYQPPMTIVGQVQIPVSNDQFKIVQHVGAVDQSMGSANLMNQVDTSSNQVDYGAAHVQALQQQHQQSHQIVHQIHLQQPQHLTHDPQTTTALDIESFQHLQQPQTIMTTQSNHNFQQAYTMVASNISGNLMIPSPSLQVSSNVKTTPNKSTTNSKPKAQSLQIPPATTTQQVETSKTEFNIPQTQIFNDNNNCNSNNNNNNNNNNNSGAVKNAQNKSTANSKPKAATSRSRSKPTAKAAKNGTTNKTGTGRVIKQTASRNQKQKQQQSQPQPPTISYQPPMTIVGQVQIPVSNDQFKIVQHVGAVDQSMGSANLMNQVDTSSNQVDYGAAHVQALQQQHQQSHQIVHQIHLQQPQHLTHDPQTTTALDIESFQHLQQPQTIMTTQSNHNFQQAYTMVASNISGNLMNSSNLQPQHQHQHQHQHQPQHHHQQQQQTHQQQTQPNSEEQLSAEELEQHLESRRMEQAALLMPDWESSVPSEIFGTDAAIKFMAED